MAGWQPRLGPPASLYLVQVDELQQMVMVSVQAGAWQQQFTQNPRHALMLGYLQPALLCAASTVAVQVLPNHLQPSYDH